MDKKKGYANKHRAEKSSVSIWGEKKISSYISVLFTRNLELVIIQRSLK